MNVDLQCIQAYSPRVMVERFRHALVFRFVWNSTFLFCLCLVALFCKENICEFCKLTHGFRLSTRCCAAKSQIAAKMKLGQFCFNGQTWDFHPVITNLCMSSVSLKKGIHMKGVIHSFSVELRII